MRLLLPSAILFFLSTMLFSQNTVFRGIVSDEKTKELLPGVAVRYSATGTVTDFNGEFFISGIAGSSLTIEMEYIGYEKTKLSIVFPMADTIRKNILLKGMNEILDRKSTRLNSSHTDISRMPSSA